MKSSFPGKTTYTTSLHLHNYIAEFKKFLTALFVSKDNILEEESHTEYIQRKIVSILFYTLPNVNQSYEKTKLNNELIQIYRKTLI